MCRAEERNSLQKKNGCKATKQISKKALTGTGNPARRCRLSFQKFRVRIINLFIYGGFSVKSWIYMFIQGL